MAKKFPIIPLHPERICWGCDKYCPSDSLACGNGSERVQHPCELFGDDWADWDPLQSPSSPTTSTSGSEHIAEHQRAKSALTPKVVC